MAERDMRPEEPSAPEATNGVSARQAAPVMSPKTLGPGPVVRRRRPDVTGIAIAVIFVVLSVLVVAAVAFMTFANPLAPRG